MLMLARESKMPGDYNIEVSLQCITDEGLVEWQLLQRKRNRQQQMLVQKTRNKKW